MKRTLVPRRITLYAVIGCRTDGCWFHHPKLLVKIVECRGEWKQPGRV